MSDADEARRAWDQGVTAAHGRARLAAAALLGMAAVNVCITLSGVLQRAGILSLTFAEIGGVATSVQSWLHLATIVLFLLWLAKSVNLATALQVSPPLSWTGRQACWSFFIPFANFVRPYHVIKDLHDRLDPEGVPEPAPRPRLDGAGGYRRVEMEKAPPPGRLPHASIGAWWGLYMLGGLAAQLLAWMAGGGLSPQAAGVLQVFLVGGAETASALLAVMVVRAIDGRLVERNRRLQHGSDEELKEWGVAP